MTPQWLEHAQVDNAITLDIASLNTMYSQSTYLWIKNQKLSNQGLDAVDFISGSFKHGLNPDHYHLSELTQLNPSHDRLSVQQFDILLTDGLLTLIHDIAVGRLQANNVDSDWFIPQNEFNAVEFLQDALLKPHLKTQLNSLSPNTAEYHQLQAALSRYQSYVSRGSWLNIPSMPLTHLGERQKHIPLIRERLRFENKELVLSSKKRANYYDLFLEQAVRNFQHKHGLKVDGIIGSNTRKAMNISANERLQQIKVALERHRWMPRKLGQRYLLINVANYQLHGINNGNEALNMKVIVGRKSRPTPSFFSKVNHLVFNPYWNVPRKLARLDLLPKQQENLNYFYLHDIRVFTKNNGHKVEHDPYSIDWQSVSRSNFPYTFRQDPGENNALGKLKFMFPNQWSIYIHDTPHRELFLETKRALSSGCIRVEDPIALANFGLPKPKAQQTIMDMLESKENRGMKLSSPLSLYVVYFTVWTNDNGIQFSPDIYQRDKRIAALL
ncbi:MAG: L,D-transpeptidase family protein [Methylophaga sp.]|nr:L,D-transpeptidase family protein [Methylophaga sp.]